MAPVRTDKDRVVPQNVLVVDDEPVLLELLSDVVDRQLHCRVLCAKNMREARRILARESIDLLVTDLHLPDGDGMSLLPLVRDRQPAARTLVITGQPSMDGAIDALRHGAVDFLPKPFSAQQLTDHLRIALEQQAESNHRHKRLKTLRRAVKRLNEARKMVSRKVDLLCHDLISAYTELSKQLDGVRLQEGYRHMIGQTAELEQLLCHTMDWLIRQLGYANVGIWLAADDKQYSLGAYMKYTIAGEPPLAEALQRNLVPMAARKGLVHLAGPEVKELLTPAELKHLAEQDILAANCTYLGDTLAVIVMFRDARTPFSDEDVEALKVVSPLFAVALTKAVKHDQPSEDSDEPSEGGTQQQKRRRPPRKDPADWWKRGEEPPY